MKLVKEVNGTKFLRTDNIHMLTAQSTKELDARVTTLENKATSSVAPRKDLRQHILKLFPPGSDAFTPQMVRLKLHQQKIACTKKDINQCLSSMAELQRTETEGQAYYTRRR